MIQDDHANEFVIALEAETILITLLVFSQNIQSARHMVA